MSPQEQPATEFTEWMTLEQAAAYVAHLTGKTISRYRAWYWCHTGAHGVRLRYSRVGHNLIVRQAAVDQFLLDIENKLSVPQDKPLRGRPTCLTTRLRVTAVTRAQQIKEAQDILSRQGIG